MQDNEPLTDVQRLWLEFLDLPEVEAQMTALHERLWEQFQAWLPRRRLNVS